jgi:transposase InsO family protein
VKLLDRPSRLRRLAIVQDLSQEAKKRLEWILWLESSEDHNVARVARHFGIARKTLYHWLHRFDEKNLKTLEEKSTAPKKTRQREYTPLQYARVVALRRAHIRYGKMKLLVLYRHTYPEDARLSAWNVQCIIECSGLYYHAVKQARINRKRSRSVKRKKITDLKTKQVSGFLLCLDTVILYWKSKKRYVLTAIDKHSKVAFARMYTTHSSSNSRDFLYRLHYLLDGRVENVQTDNGSEFHLHFDTACQKLNISHYRSRVKTPKDNAVNERFNRTLQEEFVHMGHMTDNITIFNRNLTDWLIEYNFRRPHQTLDYMPPMNFQFKYHKVLPMYPSSTKY